MNRYLKIVVAMFLMIFTFVSTLQPLAVQAATQLADGEYSIGFKVLKDASDEVSMMNEYSVSPGTLKVKDGKKKVSFTLKNSSWITKFETDKAGQLVGTNVISEDKEKDTRVVEFEVEDVEKILKAKVKVDIDFLNYHHEYDVRIAFDQNSITPIHVENQMKKRTQLISQIQMKLRIQVRSPTKSLTQINNQILTQLKMVRTAFLSKC